MEIKEIFPVPKTNFKDSVHFHEYLINNYDCSKIKHYLTMVVGLTERSTDDLLKKLEEYGFHIARKLGAIYHLYSYSNLDNPNNKEKIETFLNHDEKTGIMIFYSNYKKEDEIPIITEFTKNDWKSFQLFVRPPIMEDIKDYLLCEYENAEITNFTAKYFAHTEKESRMRPIYTRTIGYWGDDGKETLEEMEYYYGVSPTLIHVKMPNNISFRIKNEGIFTFCSGEIGSIKIILKIIEKAIRDSIKFLEVFNQTSFNMLPVKTEKKSLNIPISKPALISLKNKLLYSKIEDFEKECSKIGTIINSSAEEGSLFYCADILTDKEEEFRIIANEEQVEFYPRTQNCHFNTFMSFYYFIVDKFDDSAEFEILKG